MAHGDVDVVAWGVCFRDGIEGGDRPALDDVQLVADQAPFEVLGLAEMRADLLAHAREPHDPGPPVVTEEQIRDELGQAFQLLDLHEFRFDEAPGVAERFLGWSCLVEKR